MKNQTTNHIRAVLFDLDGTLVDTAHDLLEAMNLTLTNINYPTITHDDLRQHVTGGVAHMFRKTTDLNDQHDHFRDAIADMLANYEMLSGSHATLFPGIDRLLNHLDQTGIPWGIVTNKSRRFSEPLVEKLGLSANCQTLISGDTFERCKPHPLPLLFGCQQLGSIPNNTLYVGDYRTDVEASKAAGMPHVCVTYGYYPANEHPYDWHAQYIAHTPEDIIKLV